MDLISWDTFFVYFELFVLRVSINVKLLSYHFLMHEVIDGLGRDLHLLLTRAQLLPQPLNELAQPINLLVKHLLKFIFSFVN